MAVWLTRVPGGDTSLQKLYEKYKSKGLVVLGVNTADDRQIALDYLKENKVTFPNVLDASDGANKALQQYETLSGMCAVPFTYLIDREGKVVEAWYGYEERQHEHGLRRVELK
jgi:peroxiredoxin